MGKPWMHVIFSLAILLACCGCAFALDPSLDVSQYAHTAWKVRDGFTKGSITSNIAQTADGYLWLGTEFGLVRFDGVRAVAWQPPSGQQLPSDQITRLFVASDGALWIGTHKGLARLRDGRLTTYPELQGQGINGLIEDQGGTVWAGGTGFPSPGKLCAIRGDGVQCFGEDGSLGAGIADLYQDRQGNLWASAFNGLWHWQPGPPRFFPISNGEAGAVWLAEDEEGRLLIGDQTGVHSLVGGRYQPYPPVSALGRFWAGKMLRDRDGTFWIANHSAGLVHVHQGRLDGFSQTDGLSGNLVIDFFEDREGNVWVATSDGLDRFHPYSVTTVTFKQGLSSGGVLSVLAANNGSVWIGSTAGLDRWERGRISAVKAVESGGNTNAFLPNSLFQDSDGRIWVSTPWHLGYLEGKRFVAISDLPRGFVHYITEEPEKQLWVANQEAGLLHLADGKVVQKFSWDDLGHKDPAFVMASEPSQKGVWLGFWEGGLAHLANGRIQKAYSVSDGLGRGRVTDLRFGPRGTLWVATERGMSRIKDGHVLTLTRKNGLPCDFVHWTMEDDDHSMWLNMPCGLARIARSELDAWAAEPARAVQTTVFDTSDGVRSSSHAGTYRAPVAKTADGRIWFIVRDGVSVIDPHNLHENKLPPPVHIEKITADDKTVEPSNGMHLPTGVRHLDFDYTALSLVVPEKVRFRVKLEGEDKDWRELVNVRHVEYTNLPPKHYRFRVLACNNSGVWNEEGATLDFVIPPAWYQTNWFRAACLAAFFAMLWGIYELRVRQLAHQFSMRLEERVAERTRIARDLHDTLLQSFQALLPRLQASINMVSSRPDDARRNLEQAADQASQAIAEGRDAIQGMRMSTVEKNDLAVAIRTLGEELASAATNRPSPNFNVVVEGTSRNLHPILRDEVYRLTTEALRNAFRHAAAQNVEVEIRYDEKYFRLRVRDDGKGIPSDVLSGDGREGHYGLPGMRERAKLVGGKLTIWTEVDGGTEIELNIPGAKAYVKSARPYWYFGKRSATEKDEKEPIERE